MTMNKTRVAQLMIAIAVALMMTAPLLASPVRADSTVTFTSTADFDAGNKGSTAAGAGVWVTRAPLPQPVADSAGATLNGFFYNVGGYQNSSLDSKAYNYRYSPGADSWASLAPLSVARWGSASTTWADRIYIFSGATGAASTNASDYYNTTDALWHAVVPTPLDLTVAGVCAVTVGSFIYLSVNSVLYQFDPQNVGPSPYTSLTGPSAIGTWSTCAAVGNFIYVLGGTTDADHVKRYDITNDTWNNVYDTSPYGTVRYGMTRNSPVIGGEIYTGYGKTDAPSFQFFTDVWKYNPLTKAFTSLERTTFARDGVTSAAIGGILYVTSGRNLLSNPTGIAFHESLNPAGFTSDGDTVDTTSNNLKTTADVFELSNARSDRFSTDDRNGQTFKWSFLTDGTKGTCNVEVSSGKLRSNNTGQSGLSCTEITNASFSGDFDTRVKTTFVSGTTSGYSRFMALNEKLHSWNQGSATVDGALLEIVATGSTTNLYFFTITNGAPSACGTNPVSRGNQDFYVRIAAVGTTWTAYASDDASAWSTTHSCTNVNVGPWYFLLNTINEDAHRIWDDFFVSSGAINSPAYRLAGSWTSATQTFVSDILSSVTVDYAGASASGYISSIAIVDATGATLWSDNTHRISGSTVTLSLPSSGLRHNWGVKVNLAGDGSTTPTVLDVVLSLVPDPSCFATSSMGSTLTTILPIVLLLSLLVAVAGVFLGRKGSALDGLNPSTTSLAVISVIIVIVVFVAVIANGLIAARNICG